MKPRSRTGQAMVEFALTGTLFFTMLLFVIDGGRMLWTYVAVAEAARVGARYAITHGSLSSTPIDASNQSLLVTQIENTVTGLEPNRLTVAATWLPSNVPGSKVSVQVSYAAQPVTDLFWPGAVLNLQSTSTMVIEN